MNIKIVLYFLGSILKLEAVSMLPPLLIAVINRESSVTAFIISILISLTAGILLSQKNFKDGRIFAREGYAATGLGWIIMSIIGALPFFISGAIPSFIDAFFEIVSGFTTTGASILTDIDSLGKGLIFWRSESHLLGGMGVLVLILAIMPMNGGYHMQFMKAESPGPTVSKLVPRVKDTAKTLYIIYIVLTVITVFTLWISGMPLFDAICLGMGTAGTGGFSISNEGMGIYNNVSQALITFWMLVFGVNFNVYFLMTRKKFKDALKSEELRTYLLIFGAAVIFLTVTNYFSNYREEGLYYSFHHSAFTVSSLMTSTGYGTVDSSLWTESARRVVLLIMFIGASAGSTGGGLKVSRVMLLMREASSELHHLIHPRAVRPVKFEGKPVEKETIKSLNNYLTIYIAIFLISLFLLSFDRYSFTTDFSAVLATLNNIGPGLDEVGAMGNYSNYSVFSKAVLIFDMLAGRLELLPVVMLFYRGTWRKN